MQNLLTQKKFHSRCRWIMDQERRENETVQGAFWFALLLKKCLTFVNKTGWKRTGQVSNHLPHSLCRASLRAQSARYHLPSSFKLNWKGKKTTNKHNYEAPTSKTHVAHHVSPLWHVSHLSVFSPFSRMSGSRRRCIWWSLAGQSRRVSYAAVGGVAYGWLAVKSATEWRAGWQLPLMYGRHGAAVTRADTPQTNFFFLSPFSLKEQDWSPAFRLSPNLPVCVTLLCRSESSR